MTVSFGGMTLDTQTRQLRRGRSEIHLSPKAYELLTLLIEHRPEAVAKEMLINRLWPAVFVSESNLAGLVAEIRRAIGDDARTPRFVRTVQRFGYAFVGTVTDGTPAVSGRAPESTGCWLLVRNELIPLAEGETVLGRDDAAIPFDAVTVSRRHARIVVRQGAATIEDLGSKNGTTLAGRPLVATTVLADGDEIVLGSVALIFRRSRTGRSTRTVRPRD